MKRFGVALVVAAALVGPGCDRIVDLTPHYDAPTADTGPADSPPASPSLDAAGGSGFPDADVPDAAAASPDAGVALDSGPFPSREVGP